MKTTTSRLAAKVAALLFTMALSAQTTYDLKVGGIQVTSANKDDITGEGLVKYDATNNLLYVNGSFTTKSGSSIITNKIPGLRVWFMKSCTLSTTANAISTTADMELIGMTKPCQVTISSPRLNGIGVSNGATLRISMLELTLNVESRGIYGDKKSTLNIDWDSKVIIPSTTLGAIFDFAEIKMYKGITVISPEGGYVSGGKIVDASGTVAKSVEIGEQKYHMNIFETSVTSFNCDDILGDGGSFRYDPKQNILHVAGGTYEPTDINSNIIYNQVQDLKVSIEGDVTFKSPFPISSYQDIVIVGNDANSKLTIEATNSGILSQTSAVTIKNLNLNVNAPYCFYGNNRERSVLTFINSNVSLNSTLGAIQLFNTVNFDGCSIISPSNVTYKKGTNQQGNEMLAYYDSNGNIVTNMVISDKKVEMYELYICDTQVSTLNCNDILGDGVVSYDPEKNVLTINGTIRMRTDDGIFIYNKIEGLTINIDGPSAMIYTDDEYNSDCIYSTEDITIQGNNNQLIVDQRIYSNNGLIIKDCNLVTKGITSYEYLVIRNSDVMSSDNISLLGGGDLKFENCYIAWPEGATIRYGNIRDGDDYAKNIVIHRGSGGSSSNKYDVNGDGSIDTQDVLNIYDEMQKQ